MSYLYHTTWERLFKAVDILASGTETIQKRLYYASVELSPLKIEEFPEELQDIVPFVYRPSKEGFSQEQIAAMPDDEARLLAEKIVETYDTIAREYCFPDNSV